VAEADVVQDGFVEEVHGELVGAPERRCSGVWRVVVVEGVMGVCAGLGKQADQGEGLLENFEF